MNSQQIFRRLWLGESINLYIEQFFAFAAPLIVATTLHGGVVTGQLLTFLFFVPYLMIGLNAGVWLESRRKWTFIVAASGLQSLILAVVSVFAAPGALTVPLLAGLVLASGVIAVFFQISYQSYLPTLSREREFLQRCNSRLALSDALTRVAGPATAGWIIAFAGVSASFAVLAAAMVVATLAFFQMSYDQPVARRDLAADSPAMAPSTKTLILEGFKYVAKHAWLNPIIYCGAFYMVCVTAIRTTVILYLVVVVRTGETIAGMVVACIAVGYGIGSFVSGRLASRIGTRRTLQLSAIVAVCGLAGSSVAATTAPTSGSIAILSGLALLVHGCGDGIFAPTAIAVRQIATPMTLMSRVTSVHRFLIWGGMSAGALLAAASTALIGVRPTLLAMGLGAFGTLGFLYRKNLSWAKSEQGGNYERDPQVALRHAE